MSGIETGIGLDVVLWFQSWRGPLMEAYALLFDLMGSVEFYLMLLPLVYWCVDAAFGRRLGVLVLSALWGNETLKGWWARPRPFQVSDRVHNLKDLGTYGLPSGHSQVSTTLWGSVAIQIRRYWVTALVVVYVILMGISRLVMGVHFPQDVLAGWAIGLLWLVIYAWAEPRLSRWLPERHTGTLVGLVLGVTALGLVIQPGLIPFSSTAAMESSISSLGAFLGVGLGFVLEPRILGFDARGTWWKRLLRLVLGLVVALVLRFGLGALFEGLEPAPVFRLVRYALMGFWVAGAAPWVFVKTRLADLQTGS